MFYITWVESDKAELVEEMLDEREVPIEMLPTPEEIRDREVFVCKDCFQVLIVKEEVLALDSIEFPAETRCFDQDGELLWAK